jgi:hypothetical protein
MAKITELGFPGEFLTQIGVTNAHALCIPVSKNKYFWAVRWHPSDEEGYNIFGPSETFSNGDTISSTCDALTLKCILHDMIEKEINGTVS